MNFRDILEWFHRLRGSHQTGVGCNSQLDRRPVGTFEIVLWEESI